MIKQRVEYSKCPSYEGGFVPATDNRKLAEMKAHYFQLKQDFLSSLDDSKREIAQERLRCVEEYDQGEHPSEELYLLRVTSVLMTEYEKEMKAKGMNKGEINKGVCNLLSPPVSRGLMYSNDQLNAIFACMDEISDRQKSCNEKGGLERDVLNL